MNLFWSNLTLNKQAFRALAFVALALSVFSCEKSNGTIGSGAIMTEPGTYLLTAYFNSSNSSVRVNGSFLNNGSIANTTLSRINLGDNFARTSQLDGSIAETVFYASNADITKVEGYLAHKWGVDNLLPTDHTYKNNPPINQ